MGGGGRSGVVGEYKLGSKKKMKLCESVYWCRLKGWECREMHRLGSELPWVALCCNYAAITLGSNANAVMYL